jgi:methyl-accepting chemotaxis protein
MLNLKTRGGEADEPRDARIPGERDRRERTEPQLVYDGTQDSAPARAADGSATERVAASPFQGSLRGHAPVPPGPVISPGARSLAANRAAHPVAAPLPKKKELAEEEEDDAAKVAPTLRGWKKRKAQNEVQTLVLIALMFAVPIIVLEVFVVSAQSESIASAGKELDGYRYASPILATASALSLHSGLATQFLSGNPSVQGRMTRAGREVTDALNTATAQAAALPKLHVQGEWSRLTSRWSALTAELAGLTPEQSLRAHAELTEGLRSMLARAGEESGLVLDPDAETYYLIIPSLQVLPAVSTSLGEVRAQGALAARAGQITPERREALASSIALARRSLKAAGESLDTAFRTNLDSRAALGGPAKRALADAGRVLDEAGETFRPDRAIEIDPDAWFQTATQAIQGVDKLSQAVAASATNLLETRVAHGKRERLSTQGVSLFFVFLALVGLALVGRNLVHSIRERQEHAKMVADEYKGNQAAILHLMEEMSAIADGDLTARAHVGEDITGAIADSVNVTVAQLQVVVESINDTAGQVTLATARAQEIATRLTEAASRQVKDIEQAVGSVQLMTRSIGEVSTSADQSADVARQSLETTERGARAVHASVGSMTQIRDQIQETSKRIKRLGESSQEIGEIVDLISDISEQTNVLALNAAIQAATAGEAGRGFTVVAEEVQRLAERSAEATKQIGGLVKTIQGDTQEAVSAMESSTQGVVEGTKLSDAAGQALKEIEQVTRNLSELIQSIAVSTQMQVEIADEVRKLMHEVLTITRETTDGTHQTTRSMTELTHLTEQLRASVQQFKVA